MKLGVYVAAHKSPVFLRLSLLQIARQTRLPDVLAVYVNGVPDDPLWTVGEILGGMHMAGTEVTYKHVSVSLPMPKMFVPPLRELIERGCNVFAKLDYDDFVDEDHLAHQMYLYNQAGADYAMNINSQLLVMGADGNPRHNPRVNFGKWNPTGAHPNNIIFNGKIALDLLDAMNNNLHVNDDALLAKILPNYKGRKYDVAPTTCFVSHGKNASTAHWSHNPPEEVLGS